MYSLYLLVPATCESYKKYGVKESGFLEIDPDGFGNGEGPFHAECLFEGGNNYILVSDIIEIFHEYHKSHGFLLSKICEIKSIYISQIYQTTALNKLTENESKLIINQKRGR